MRIYISVLAICITLSSCDLGKEQKSRIAFLESEIEHLQETNNNLLGRLEDLAVISMNDSESIKESLTTLNKQYEHIQGLTDEIQQKDSLNQALVENLKRSLIDVNQEDIDIRVQGSAVYVSLSEKMLFPTASSRINKAAYNTLEKVATIINDHSGLEILVRGHTDNIPIANRHYSDNWDLSVNRATSVVKVLQERFEVDPARLTAAGKGEFSPVDENDTAQGRKLNRRTEIIITPDLSQFFDLLSSPELMS